MNWISKSALMLAIPFVSLVFASGVDGRSRAPAKPLIIQYQTSGCFGFCPAYSVTVAANGLASFKGESDTSVKGQRRFKVSATEFQAFANTLEYLIYAKGGTPGSSTCPLAHTDDITVTVHWTMSDGTKQALAHYFGCDSPEFEKMEKRLVAAPRTLPIKAYVGKNF
jgi:Domain of unknown function (DUF6438)